MRNPKSYNRVGNSTINKLLIMKKLSKVLLIASTLCFSFISTAQNVELKNNNATCSVVFDQDWQDPSSCSITRNTNTPVAAGATVIVPPPITGFKVVETRIIFTGSPTVTITSVYCSGGASGGVNVPITDCNGASTTCGWDDNNGCPTTCPQQFYVN